MSIVGRQPFAVILCKPSDQPQEPQSPAFFRGFLTGEDPRSWAQPFWIVDPKVKTAPPGAGMAVVARRPDHLDVFWAADDGAIWSTWWNARLNGGRWNAPFPITAPNVAPPGSAVAAVARQPDHLDVFWADNAGAVGTNWWDGKLPNGNWNQHGAFRITGVNVVPPGGGVAVVARRPNQLDVFWADNAGAIGTNWWNGDVANGGWEHGAFRITNTGVVPPGASVAAIARFPDHMDVFWLDDAGAVGTNWWDGKLPNGNWNQHGAFRITDANVAPPGGGVAAVARMLEHLDVFWLDNGGAVGTQWWDGNLPNGNWNQHGAFRISASKLAPPGGQVSAVARQTGQLDVLWVDKTGAVTSTWWNAAANNGQWNIPFPVSKPGVVPPGRSVATLARFPEHLDVFWADDFRGIGSSFWPAPSPFGLARYWWDMSYGQFDANGTQVFGWFNMPGVTKAQFVALGRQAKINACISAATANGVKIGDFFKVIAITNVISDSGSSGGSTILDPGAWTLGWAAHESGHDLGLDHSFDDSPVSCSPPNDGRPGAYGDGWDIMSFACYGGINPMFSPASGFGNSGPGLHAVYREKLGWIPANRILEITAGTPSRRVETLAALNHVEAPGPLMVKVFVNPADRSEYYTLEFRRQEGWDAGIGGDTVLIHQVKNGLPYLIRAAGGPERRPGHHVDVFWPDKGEAVGSSSWDVDANGGLWNSPFRITDTKVVPPTGAVSAVSRRPDILDVFWIDEGGAVGSQWWSGEIKNGGWNEHPAFRITAPQVAPPGGGISAVARYPDHLDVFWADNGGAIGTTWWDPSLANGEWSRHSPFRISGLNVLPPGGGVAAVSRFPDHLDVFWIDNAGAVGTNWWDGKAPGGSWDQHGAFRISDANVARPGGGVAAVARHEDQLDVFWVGNDGAIRSNWWNGGLSGAKWNVPFRISDPASAPPGGSVAAAARFPDHLDVFWAGEDGAIWSNWWDARANNGQWNKPFRITGAGEAPPGAPVAAGAPHADHLDVFWADHNGTIQTVWWDGQLANGGWNQHGADRLTTNQAVSPGAGVSAVARYADLYTDPSNKWSLKVLGFDARSSTARVEIVLR